MGTRITRRDALKMGTTAAASAAMAPVLPRELNRSIEDPSKLAKPSRDLPSAENRSTPDLCELGAEKLAQLFRTKGVSAREVMAAHWKQIQRVNAKVNAIVTLVPEEQLMAQALAADEALANGKWLGPLHGIPVAAKDLHETKGIRTTFGSPLFREHVPDFDCLVVEREKSAGAIVVGKSNVPEFGFGSQTFNQVFGVTRNPYDVTKTCGGSTGGGAVAVACGMTPLADGSDMGGSLRNPPSFCGVVGIRSSPGRVPNTPSRLGWQTLSVAGPVARNVSDCAFFLSVLAGFDRRSPIALDQPGRDFTQELGRSFKGVRVAFCKDLGLPWDSQVKAAVTSQRKVFESLGCIVEEAEPDFRDANECFLAWRHWSVELAFGDILESKGDQLNEYVHWHVEEGRKLTGPYLARIEAKRTALYERVRTFMEKYEFFVLPVNQVLPFDAHVHYPTEITGVKMESYMAWMKSAYYISAVGNPAVSVPCAYSAEGLPIGMQIVGRHHDDWGVLQMAYAFEQACNLRRRRPSVMESA
jgi:amidase